MHKNGFIETAGQVKRTLKQKLVNKHRIDQERTCIINRAKRSIETITWPKGQIRIKDVNIWERAEWPEKAPEIKRLDNLL